MPDFLAPYSPSILALGVFGVLHLVQLLVANVAAIRRKHIPGTPIEAKHKNFLFRSSRAHANTVESIGAAILIAGFAILSGGDPAWVNGGLWGFVACRAAHTLAYWADLRPARSVAFGLSIASLFLVFGIGAIEM